MAKVNPRIAASSYSNTAPLIWSFLYGSEHGNVEIILDNAPARSAELLRERRVDAALVPVIASQSIDNVQLVPDVCVGASTRVRSVCLVTRGCGLDSVHSVSLDISSRTSVVLTKIIFREFLGFEPKWLDAAPDIDSMLSVSDAALLIGDPALALSVASPTEALTVRTFDLAELWRSYTGLGFIFAMWMTALDHLPIDLASARDEGLAHLEQIAANYESQLPLTHQDMVDYLSTNISYTPDESMKEGMRLYLDLAFKNGLIENEPKISYIG